MSNPTLGIKTKTLWAIGFVAYFIFLLLMMPATWMIHRIPSLSQHMSAVAGNLFEGQAQLRVQGRWADLWDHTQISWQFRPFYLLTGGLGFQLHLKNTALDTQGVAILGIRQLGMKHWDGFVDGSWLSRFLDQQKISFDHRLQLTQVSIWLNYRKPLMSSASGQLTWPGGIAHYSMNEKMQSVQFPALTGSFSHEKDQLQLAVTETRTQGSVVQFSVTADGWGSAMVFKRMLKLIGQLNQKAKGDELLFTFREKIF